MKRKIAIFIAAVTLAVSLAACGNTETPDTPVNSEKAEITTTTAEETTTTEATTTKAPETTTAETTVTTVEETTVETTVTTTVTTAQTTAPKPETTAKTTTVTTVTTPKATTATTPKPEDSSKPYFERNGIVCNGEISGSLDSGANYDLDFLCKDKKHITNGRVIMTNFKTFKSDKDHAALDGYEWQTVSGMAMFGADANYSLYGFDLPFKFDDYYTPVLELYKNSSDTNCYTMNFKGKEYTQCTASLNGSSSQSDYGAFIYFFQWSFRVPEGYDGVVVYFDKYGSKSALDAFNADKNAVFFRLKK